MCGIGLATKGMICRGREEIIGIGGGGVIYRDRKVPPKFKFPKVDADLIEVIDNNSRDCIQVSTRLETVL